MQISDLYFGLGDPIGEDGKMVPQNCGMEEKDVKYSPHSPLHILSSSHLHLLTLYLGFKTAQGTNISSNEIPPCWNV